MAAPPHPPVPSPAPAALRWDIFCRVIDNHGDIGVGWRLATALAAKGDSVRLICDDLSALAWMAQGHLPRDPGSETAAVPTSAPGLAVLPWPGGKQSADVVVEAFGCDPPAAYVQAMHTTDPVWINLEYLSAEDYVERSHGLSSPRADGLRKWFFFPGFTADTGGLLREAGLMQRRASFDRLAWLVQLGLRPAPGERVASLFCYENAAIGPLLATLADQPTLLLLAPGAAQRQVAGVGAVPGLRTAELPWLSQTDFDHLLWACDLNGVRGEDSLVRALWAGSPFLWQAYPQQGGAHAAKVRALLGQLQLPNDAAAALTAWNGLAPWPGLPAAAPWRAATEAARGRLLAQDDLATQLRRFALERGRPPRRPR